MSDEIQAFLSSSPVFQDVPEEEMAVIALLFRQESYPAKSIILRQGGYSGGVYFLRSGRLAARIQRGSVRETVAYLQPPDIFGELSFVTGRACVCDVEVEVDAEVVMLPKEALPRLPQQREPILRALMRVIAGRLQDTVVRGAKTAELPVVLLRNHPHWGAPWSFGAELARSLARQSGRETLLVNLGAPQMLPLRPLEEHATACHLPARPEDTSFRSQMAQRLTEWKRTYDNVILNLVGSHAAAVAEAVGEFANWEGDLVGPEDTVPAEVGESHFVVQSSVKPTLPILSGRQQLIWGATESERAFRTGQPVSDRFRRTVDSIARAISGLQVGLALGGGAAWGWAHIGVLAVLEEAGLPIDMMSGCSMGSVMGAFRAAGLTAPEMVEIANYWRTRTRRFLEWRLWRICLLNERVIRKVFRQYFGERQVNQTDIPYWANAVDIQTGKEFAIQNGSLVECVRASIALPGLLPPVAIGPHLLVDAGVLDPVPVRLVRQMGCHYALGVNAMAALESQKVSSTYPLNVFDVLTRCMFLIGHEIGQARAELAANLVFTPALGDISMLQFGCSPQIIECGRRAAEENLPAILAGYEQIKAHSRPEAQPAAR